MSPSLQPWQTLLPLEQIMLQPYTPPKPDIITVIFSLTAPITLSFLRETLIPRLLHHPRFSAIPTFTPFPHYIPQPTFTPTSSSLDHHIHLHPTLSPSDFITHLSTLLSTPLDLTRPLWSLHLYPSAPLPHIPTESTLVFRVHHSLTDGIGLLKYFLAHIADNPSNKPPISLLTPSRRANNPHPSRPLLQSIRESLSDFVQIFFKPLFPDPPSVFTQPPVAIPSLCALHHPAHQTIPILKTAALSLSLTINDLLFAAFTAAIRQYLLRTPDHPKHLHKMRVAMPFNSHVFHTFDSTDVSNQLVMLPVPLPAHLSDRAARIHHCQQAMSRLKRGYQPAFASFAMRTLVALPSALRRAAWHVVGSSASALFSNLAGPTERMSIGGVDVSAVFFFPPPDVHVSVDVGIFSYAGGIFMGAAGDANRLKEPMLLLELISEEIDLIVDMSREVGNVSGGDAACG